MFVTFLIVVIICIILVKEDEEYASWLLDKVTSTNLVNIVQETKDAETLAQEIRVMCLVMTHPANHKTKALKVKYLFVPVKYVTSCIFLITVKLKFIIIIIKS